MTELPPDARVLRADGDGPVTFVSAPAGADLPVDGGDTPTTRAQAFVQQYGAAFGEPTASDLEVVRTTAMAAGGTSVHFQQFENEVPVFAGELRVQVTSSGKVRSAEGELSVGPAVDTDADLPPAQARQAAAQAVGDDEGLDSSSLTTGEPELWVYDAALVGEPAAPPTLVWRVEVSSDTAPVRVWAFIEADSGATALLLARIMEDKDREICDNANVIGAPFGCPSAGVVRAEGAPPTGIADIDKAYELSGATYDFYDSRFGRDSIDGGGMTLSSTVRHCPDVDHCPFANAFWNGQQMVYGNGFASADDVVGHELTHGVTEHTSGLAYLNQSGAINESMSDVFGELIDLTYDSAFDTDTPASRWLIGEDLPPSIGVIRDMEDPTAFGDPDRMGSPLYYNGGEDYGGVHTNSGVNNKAAVLMVDGGTFNGQVIDGIGISKVGRIYYETQVNLLGTGSGYSDLGYALVAACEQTVGVEGITATDCDQVTKAVAATEMLVLCGSTLQPVQSWTDPIDLAARLVGPGVSVTGATYSGARRAAGCFSGLPDVGFDHGLVLGSGSVSDVAGSNTSCCTGTDLGLPGDTELSSIVGAPTHDAASLSVDFVPTTARISFRYVFASEEYEEWVGSAYNDVFGFFVNGQNCATVGGDPVSVNSINANRLSSAFVRNSGQLDIEMDGLTTVLTCRAVVTPGQTNNLRVVIADTSDGIYDSAVFLEQGSLSTAQGASGTVTSLSDDYPLSGVFVALLRTSDFSIAGGGVTDAVGSYDVDVGAGSYFVYVLDPSGRYVNGFYGSPTPVVVPEGGGEFADVTMTPLRGSIQATVTETGTGDPIGGVWGLALSGAVANTGATEMGVTANASGQLTIPGLRPGNHFVGYVDPTGAQATRFFPNSPNVPDATKVAVTAGGTTAANASLPAQTPVGTGSIISGTVTEQGTGTPLSGARVVALRASDYSMVRGAVADASGQYSLDLPAGPYKLAFLDSTGGHDMEWFDDLPSTGLGSALSVTAPGTANAALNSNTGSMAGTITDDPSGDPLAGVWVIAIGPSGIAGGAVTASDGTYTIAGLPPGTYRATFADPNGGRTQEYWNNSPDYAGAATFNVTAASTATINANLSH